MAKNNAHTKAERLAALIRDMRLDKNIPQKDLAERAGVTAPYLAKTEAGKMMEYGVEKFAGIAHALGVSTDELLRKAGYFDNLPPLSPSKPGKRSPRTSKAATPKKKNPRKKSGKTRGKK